MYRDLSGIFQIRDAYDYRVALPLVIITLFCFSFVLMHSFKSSGEVMASKAGQKPTSKKVGVPLILVAHPEPLPLLNFTPVSDTPGNVAGSIKTTSPQQPAANDNSSGSQSSGSELQPVKGNGLLDLPNGNLPVNTSPAKKLVTP